MRQTMAGAGHEAKYENVHRARAGGDMGHASRRRRPGNRIWAARHVVNDAVAPRYGHVDDVDPWRGALSINSRG